MRTSSVDFSAEDDATVLSLIQGLVEAERAHAKGNPVPTELDRNRLWERFFDQYQPMIIAWCRQCRFKNPDEIASDVMIRLVHAFTTFSFDRNHSFRGWLRKITFNVAVDAWKKYQREMPLGEFVELNASQESDAFADRLADEASSSMLAHLIQVLAIMRERKQGNLSWEIFERSVLQRKPDKEIQEELKVSKASIYTARYQIKNEIGEMLKRRVTS